MMIRRCAMLALALLISFSFPCALSEEFSGSTVFLKTRTVYADFDGTIENIQLTAGAYVQSGDRAFSLKTQRIYAQLDGTVRGLNAEENSALSQEAFVLEPKEKYELLASVSYAYDLSENKRVHTGETVYVSCVKDATHLAIGYIASVDGAEFTVYTTHGALYVGEAVNVFRAPELGYLNRIGRATVYAAKNVSVQAQGTVVHLYVREGDRVEKGEALMEYLPGENAPVTPVVSAKESGVVTEIFVKDGDTVSPGDKLYEYAAYEDMGILLELSQADMSFIVLGARAEAVFSFDPEETAHDACVTAITNTVSADGGTYRVLLSLNTHVPGLREGLSVRVSNVKQPE